jgi:4-carboxymuconolactone decarboxylase
MSNETLAQGLPIRKEVLGAEHVTEYCWSAVWGRSGLSRQTRSLLNLAMLTALNREEEFKLHVRAAFRDGVTKEASARFCSQTAI